MLPGVTIKFINIQLRRRAVTVVIKYQLKNNKMFINMYSDIWLEFRIYNSIYDNLKKTFEYFIIRTQISTKITNKQNEKNIFKNSYLSLPLTTTTKKKKKIYLKHFQQQFFI